MFSPSCPSLWGWLKLVEPGLPGSDLGGLQCHRFAGLPAGRVYKYGIDCSCQKSFQSDMPGVQKNLCFLGEALV